MLKLIAEDDNLELYKEIEIPYSGYTSVDRIGFNGKFVETCAKASKSKSTTIKLSTPNRAVIFNDNVLLMPIIIY